MQNRRSPEIWPSSSGVSGCSAPNQMKTILYLEDDEHDIFFLKRALATEQTGLNIQNVHNLGDATAYLEGKEPFSDRRRFPLPDLIVSDLSVPGGSGFQLTTWLREESRFKS